MHIYIINRTLYLYTYIVNCMCLEKTYSIFLYTKYIKLSFFLQIFLATFSRNSNSFLLNHFKLHFIVNIYYIYFNYQLYYIVNFSSVFQINNCCNCRCLCHFNWVKLKCLSIFDFPSWASTLRSGFRCHCLSLSLSQSLSHLSAPIKRVFKVEPIGSLLTISCNLPCFARATIASHMANQAEAWSICFCCCCCLFFK